jgi:hypothetical protein
VQRNQARATQLEFTSVLGSSIRSFGAIGIWVICPPVLSLFFFSKLGGLQINELMLKIIELSFVDRGYLV